MRLRNGPVKLKKSGRIKQYNTNKNKDLNKEMREKAGQMKSDDQHIIKLSIISGARLLYSKDKGLQKDFCNTLKN